MNNEEWAERLIKNVPVKPYYAKDGILIWNCDCREVLPFIGEFDLCLTDPPYGISLDTDYRSLKGSTKKYSAVIGDDKPFDPTILLRYRRTILWGANHYAGCLPVGGWIIWDKRVGTGSNMFADAELAWANWTFPARIFRHLWGVNRDTEKDRFWHPTQKPVALFRWILDTFCQDCRTVIDPYMGSGPLAEACRDTCRKYVGIEIEEKYCEIAVQRLAQDILDFGGEE